MGKLEFLDALKRAMTGLAPELQAKTLAYYEQRFVDGMSVGRTEQDIAQELDDSKKIGMTLRVSSHSSAFEQKRNPFDLLRFVVSALGLAIFNLFMVVPAAVYASLLVTMYACAFGFYVGGIAITASGLSGANELVLDGPLRHLVIQGKDFGDAHTKLTIGDTGVHVSQEKTADPMPHSHATDDADDETSPEVIKRAEDLAGRGIHIYTDMDAGSRTTQTFFGVSMVVGAVILFLLCLVVTRYTIVGLKRYIQMNFSLLKGS